MIKLTYKAKAWNDVFPEVTKTQYLVMAYLLSWQDSGGQSAIEVGMRVLEKPYNSASGNARTVLLALEKKGYVEKVTEDHSHDRFKFQKKSVRWKLTLHGCLYLKNYPMPS